ncbi:hypothetical protein COO60DRAFT_235055 [Scenedesmus sp. NREL 46B-D3]|nr:hypothetical protein COO60DRAFT_235055 [Scenedesmus sp. NREL 46B-D3]
MLQPSATAAAGQRRSPLGASSSNRPSNTLRPALHEKQQSQQQRVSAGTSMLQQHSQPQHTATAAAAGGPGSVGDSSTPHVIDVVCNGNPGRYLLEAHSVRCMCQGCSSRRRQNGGEGWLVSPTEFERHSGMSTAKKWRTSIRVAREGQPIITLGRWLDMRGIIPKASAAAAAAVGSGKDARSGQQQRESDHLLQDQLGNSAKQLGQLLAMHYRKQQQLRGPGSSSSAAAEAHQQPAAAALEVEQPLCSGSSFHQQQQSPWPCRQHTPPAQAADSAGAAAAAAAGLPTNAAGPLEVITPAVAMALAAAKGGPVSDPASAFRAEVVAQACRTAVKLHLESRPSATAAVEAAACTAAAEAEAAAAATSGRAHQHGCGAAVAAALRPPPARLQIPAVSARSAAAVGVPIPLEEAAAAAARGDDSLWLRSPVRRTPRSVRGTQLHSGLPGAARPNGAQEAVAAEVLRRLLGEDAQAAAAAAGAATASSQQPARAGGRWDSPPAGRQQQESADAADAAAASSSGDEEDGVAVGPQHQAELPLLRPLPALRAAAALLELSKAGWAGPPPQEALAIAIEERARADLLPRDAVKDVWERTSGNALALERAPRQRRAPGWQAGFVDSLKPYSLHGAAPPAAAAAAAQQPAGNSPVRDAATAGDEASEGRLQQQHAMAVSGALKGRKRSASAAREDAAAQQQQQQGGGNKRARSGSVDAAGRPSQQQQQQQACGFARRSSLDNANGAAAGSILPCNGRQPCTCGDPRCRINAAAAAATAAAGNQSTDPSGWPLGPSGVGASHGSFPQPLLPQVPSGWAQGSGICRTPIGPQLLSWLLLSPAAQQAAGAAGGSSHHMPLASCTGSEVAALAAAGAAAACAGAVSADADVPVVSTSAAAPEAAAAAAVKQEGAASLPDSPSSTVSHAQCVAAPKGARLTASGAPSCAAGGSSTASPGKAAAAAAAEAAVTLDKPAAADAAAPPADMQVDGSAGTVAAAAAAKAGSSSAGDAAPAAAAATAALVAADAAGASSSTRGLVEVRIVLDGCVFVGQLQEVGRLELARSRVAPALAPIAEAEVHAPAPAAARCALCCGPEQPGCHADQATATAATGMSRRGLGPLMPVSMGQQQQQHGVVWVHRQCALWSPEVYPDRRGMLAEPYTVTCPAHAPQQPEAQQQQPAAAAATVAQLRAQAALPHHQTHRWRADCSRSRASCSSSSSSSSGEGVSHGG